MTLTTKQKAHLLSIKSSAIMFAAGVYFNYLYFFDYNGFTAENEIGRDIVVFFTGHLVTDTYLGQVEYPEYFGFLTGYIHHSFYIVVSILSIQYKIYNVYLVFMISELPTFLLSSGSFDASMRDDLIFGYTFLATRIIYHSAMITHFWNVPMVCYIGPPTLMLHLWWFKGWFTKYLF